MDDEIVIEESVNSDLKKISDFLDQADLQKIINKLTDYAEIVTEGKLSQIINFNFSLNRSQSGMIIDLLLNTSALTRISLIAQKGTRDLENEYISNIFSDTNNPENISSYISIRNILENRLTHQTQQYNMNMGKTNTTQAMSVNELRGHVKTYIDLSNSEVSLSSKAQHGYIAASLHDAYVTLVNRSDWWNDRTYMKFFFNEDDAEKRSRLIITRETRKSLPEINRNIQKLLSDFGKLILDKKNKNEQIDIDSSVKKSPPLSQADQQSRAFNDRLMTTPFGKQYGGKIDTIIRQVFSEEKQAEAEGTDSEEIRENMKRLFDIFTSTPAALKSAVNDTAIAGACNFLIFSDFTIKGMTESFLFERGRESFSKFYSEEKKNAIEDFMTILFSRYYEIEFQSLFKIIRSHELRKFAAAFIIKRIYLTMGESLTTFGYVMVKAIAKTGKIKTI